MDLVRHFSPETYARAIEDWSWLTESRVFEPIAASPFGDLLLQAVDGVWLLDMLEGSLALRWPDTQALQAELSTEEGQDQILLAGLAIGAASAGILAGGDEILCFKIPPVLGGTFEISNIETIGFVVAASIAGQLHRQVKDLPPGARISGFTLDG